MTARVLTAERQAQIAASHAAVLADGLLGPGMAAVLGGVLNHTDRHGGLLVERSGDGGYVVREVHAADLPAIERPWPWGGAR